jgi:hypothetical protein
MSASEHTVPELAELAALLAAPSQAEWRPRGSTRAFYAGVFGMLAAGMTLGAVACLVAPSVGWASSALLGLIVFVPIACGSAWLANGVVRSVVKIGGGTVVVAGPLRKRSFPIGQVTGFEVRARGLGSAAIWLIGTGTAAASPSRATLLWATQRGGFAGGAAVQSKLLEPVAAAMNDALARARG